MIREPCGNCAARHCSNLIFSTYEQVKRPKSLHGFQKQCYHLHPVGSEICSSGNDHQYSSMAEYVDWKQLTGSTILS